MYENRYNLTSKPFNLAPTKEHYFESESIRNALVQSLTCIERASGPVIITGSPGTGKSLLLALLEQQYSSKFRIVHLQCARLAERSDLLQSLLYELELEYRGMSEGELRLALIDFLKKDTSQGLLLLVDEAHSLSTGLLDELRLITNFVKDGQQRVALVMAGSPSLEDHLIDTRCESFNQRIAARCYISPMTQKETIEYILTHIERAGGHGEELFTDQALTRVHEFSEGCPRVINQICDQALIIASHLNVDRISAEIIQDAWNQVQSLPGAKPIVSSVSVAPKVEQNEGINTAEPTQPVDEQLRPGDMVIEFGTLQSDDDSTMPAEDWTTDSKEVEIGFATEGDAGFVAIQDDAQDQNQDDVGTQSEPIVIEPFGVEEEQVFANVDTETALEVAAIEELPEPIQTYDNPFDEEFSEEERIEARFFPEVAEQNISSLTLKPDHLNFLEDIPARTDVVLSVEDTEQEAVTVEAETSSESVDSFQNEELKISAESLAQLEQIETDVFHLQNEVHTQVVKPAFSNEIETGGNESGYDESTGDETLSVAFLSQEPTTEPFAGDDEPIDNPGSPIRGATKFPIPDLAEIAVDDNQVASAGQEATGMVDTSGPANQSAPQDDRDMMVVEIQQNDLSQPGYTKQQPEVAQPVAASTGSAMRMNYEDLFKQLRNHGQNQ